MPQARFRVRLSMSSVIYETREQAIAGASSFLAFADQTDYFGYHAAIDEVAATHFEAEREWVVSILFEAPVSSSDEIEEFIDEAERLSRVDSAVCLTNPVSA